MFRVVIHGNEDMTAEKGRGASLLVWMGDEDGPRPVRNDALSDASQEQMERGTPAMGTHDNQIVRQLVRVCHDAAGYIIDFVGVYMAIDPDPFRERAFCELLQVVLGIQLVLEVRLTVHLIGRVSFHDVHEGNARLELFRQKNGRRKCGFGQQGTIKRD